MGPGSREICSQKGRYLPQGNVKMIVLLVEKIEITKDYPSCSWMGSPRDVHTSGSVGTNQVPHQVCVIFKESYMVISCPVVATPQNREDWTHQTCSDVVIDTEDSNLDDKYSVMPALIYSEVSYKKLYNPREYLRDPSSAEPTPEPGPPSEKPTKEPK